MSATICLIMYILHGSLLYILSFMDRFNIFGV